MNDLIDLLTKKEILLDEVKVLRQRITELDQAIEKEELRLNELEKKGDEE